MNDIKTPPNSVEAERAVLGAILLDASTRTGDSVMDLCLSEGVTAETFFDPRNRAVFSAMLAMNRASKPLDALTLMEDMRSAGTLEQVGGAGYVQSLIEQVATTAKSGYYIDIIKKKHLRRRMIETASGIAEKSFDESTYPDPQVVLGEAESSFLDIGNTSGGTLPRSQAVEDSFRRIDRMSSSNGQVIPFSFAAFKSFSVCGMDLSSPCF